MLTPRQREVAELVALGMRTKAIARTLGISVHTAKNHIEQAAQRLPGHGPPRHRLSFWVFTLSLEDDS